MVFAPAGRRPRLAGAIFVLPTPKPCNFLHIVYKSFTLLPNKGGIISIFERKRK